MPKTMSATETRVHFGEVLRLVNEDCDHVVVEKDGKPAAIILSLRRYNQLTGSSDFDDVLERIRAGHRIIEEAYAGEPIPDSWELINGGRDDGGEIEGVL